MQKYTSKSYILDSSAEHFFSSPKMPMNINGYKDMILSDIKSTEELILNYHRMVQEPDIPEQIWSYWDFLYFSIITITTVGYGDILPNSTKVRIWVILEILLGSILLIVLVNA